MSRPSRTLSLGTSPEIFWSRVRPESIATFQSSCTKRSTICYFFDLVMQCCACVNYLDNLGSPTSFGEVTRPREDHAPIESQDMQMDP